MLQNIMVIIQKTSGILQQYCQDKSALAVNAIGDFSTANAVSVTNWFELNTLKFKKKQFNLNKK